MGRYSSFQVHMADDIRHIQSMDTGVLFLTKNNLKCLTRGGLIMFDYTWVAHPHILQWSFEDVNAGIMSILALLWVGSSQSIMSCRTPAYPANTVIKGFICLSMPMCGCSFILFFPFFRTEEGADMHSLIQTDNNTLLMGGLQNYVVELDLTTVQETQKVGWHNTTSVIF